MLTEIWTVGSKYVCNIYIRRSYQVKTLYIFLSKWNSEKLTQDFLQIKDSVFNI